MISYWFPAAVSLTGLDPISNVLVERQWWNTSSVIHEVHALLDKDTVKVQKYIKKWCEKTILTVFLTVNDITNAEQTVYDQCSYFYYQTNTINSDIIINNDLLPEIREEADSVKKSDNYY